MPMITAADLPETLPVFPLPGALMLPRARLPLRRTRLGAPLQKWCARVRGAATFSR